LLLVQCATSDIHRVLNVLTVGPLLYKWSLGIFYDRPFPLNFFVLAVSWRSVLVLSNGQCSDYKGLRQVPDAMIEPYGHLMKKHHEWEQPLRPWAVWLDCLTRPNDLILDPFAGSGTIGVAVKAAGGRRYIGTEIKAGNAAVARKRIADWPEGKSAK
jgi:site-specific DNA-methyltransferase (adenine-specific)